MMMQAQQTRNATQTISQTQSLAAVQTLLRAGLGTITFLRNLLPEDNFSQSHFTTVDGSESSEFLSQADEPGQSTGTRRNVNSFKIMTITRGYTDEADKILNYLEHGIFDALEKRYLRSFIFAIYLDNKDPTNIVEAYTFNFKYHTIPGSNFLFPTMNLEGHSQKNTEDPIARAIKNGRAPTLKDVKTSVKAMIKTLIQAMNHMDALPRRRFATFKVFYTDETPLDYEPPNFQPGDVDKDRWYFMTHDLDEVPERCSVGKFDSGHHSVKLSVTSIASYLPLSTEDDDATFLGTTSLLGRPALTPVEEATLRRNQAEKQAEDAEQRNLLWPVEDSVELDDPDVDAEGDDDPDYTKDANGQYVPVERLQPIGVRNKCGEIEPLPVKEQTMEEHFSGLFEHVPKNLHEIVAQELPRPAQCEETQPLLLTPRNGGARALSTSLSSLSTAPTADFDPEMLKHMSINAIDGENAEMLDLETQAFPDASATIESIESFTHSAPEKCRDDINMRAYDFETSGFDCDCGIPACEEDICCFCEGGCNKWFHIWCMGYHSVDDPKMPLKFICFECRFRADITWELIKLDLYPQMFSKFKELALFRRAIKVAEKEEKFTSFEFSKAFARGDLTLSGQMLKRLEEEEFVLHETTTLDDMGLAITSHSKKGKAKGKVPSRQARTRKNMQRTRYVFNRDAVTKPQYMDCFKPDDLDVERRYIGLFQILPIKKAKPVPAVANDEETQTQETHQAIERSDKRPAHFIDESQLVDEARPKKKTKMSLAIGVDLAE